MGLKIGVPVLYDGNNQFLNNQIVGVDVLSIVVGIVQKPSGPSVVPGTVSSVNTLFVTDPVLGGLYLSMTRAEWESQASAASSVSTAAPQSSGDGASIGGDITDGEQFDILFVNPAGKFAQSPYFQYRPSGGIQVGSDESHFSIFTDPASGSSRLGDIGALKKGTYIEVISTDDDELVVFHGSAGQVNISTSALTASRARVEPDKAGTYAMTNDFPTGTFNAAGNDSAVVFTHTIPAGYTAANVNINSGAYFGNSGDGFNLYSYGNVGISGTTLSVSIIKQVGSGNPQVLQTGETLVISYVLFR